ncbi:MAG: hypothetical protein QOG85_2308 [Gaiellaceae bacterium]|jgi:hypothetical protein|nr:hypothetical protein [Gaiellaceae bacterium]
MHPDLTLYFVREHTAALRRDAIRYRRAKGAASAPPQPVRAAIQLRLSACRDELERLATLSERRLRDGDWLVADVNGVPVAAVSLADGATVYDPFKPTSQAISLLQLRRKQFLAAA